MIKNLVKTVTTFCSKNASTILTVGACAGVVATGYFAFKSGVKTVMDLQDIEFEKAGEDITPKEKAMIIVKDCAVLAAVGGLTMAMIISSRIIDIRRAKAMAASYAILAESADTFRRKVSEHIGDKEMEKVNCEIAKEEIDNVDVKKIQAINRGHGNYFCLDQITKQPFMASSDYILGRKRDLDMRAGQGEDYISVSEWCSYLDIEQPIDTVGDLVWPACMGIPLELYEDHLPSITMKNGEPGYYLKYTVSPMTVEEADIYNANHSIDSWNY
jgi:hypothetical protein